MTRVDLGLFHSGKRMLNGGCKQAWAPAHRCCLAASVFEIGGGKR